MRPWLLPAVAAAFALGVLLAPEHAARGDGAALLALGAALGGVAALSRPPPRGPNPLLVHAGLVPAAPEPGVRERVLRAAGIPSRDDAGDRSPAPRRMKASGVVAFVAASAVLGAGWHVLRRPSVADVSPAEGFVRFAGAAASDVRRFEFGWGLEVAVDVVEAEGRSRGVDARAWVSGDNEPPAVEAGTRVRGSGTLEAIAPGASGFEAYLVSGGVVAMLSAAELEPVGPPANPLLRLANAARAALRRGVERALPAREGGLLLGLSIGDTSRMDPEIERDFRATGLGHLVAVSGENVALFLVPVIGLSILAGATGATRFAIGAVAVVFFALVTRWEPSVMRASAMAVIAMAGILAGRPRSTSALLAAAVLAVLVVDPGLTRSIGFRLSVAATAGISAFATPIAARLRALPRPLALTVAATLGAQVGVSPLLLLDFGVVPTVTLLANVLASPAVAAALLGGVVAAGAALAWGPVGEALGTLARLPTTYLIAVADGLARAPLPAMTATGVVVPALVAVVAVVAAWRLRRGRRPVGTLVAVAAAVALAWASIPHAGAPPELAVTFLDVGQGDAAVVRAPNGATVLVDAGPDEEQVATDLAALGVRRLDVAIASHAHADHIEGFPSVLARFRVGVLLEPGCPSDSPSYARLLEAIEDEEVPIRHPRGGDRLTLGALTIDVLGPDACTPGGSEPNDESLVVRASFGDATVLFPGDAEEPAQRDLLDDGDPVAADVLKVPHHGGDTSLEEFFGAVDADLAVVSTGTNDYGHPVPSVLTALEATGAHVVRTDLAGDVTATIAADRVLLESAP